jgi:hemolysin III
VRTNRSGEFRWPYSVAELWADGAVHALGVVLTLVGATALLMAAAGRVSTGQFAAAGVYLATLALSIGASAAYNVWPVSRTKWLLRRLDHSAIYLLIAGTYTPFMVEVGAHRMLALVWCVAAAGIVLKLARPGRFDRLAILLYLALGWSGFAVYDAVAASLSGTVVALIVAGGIAYSVGVVFHVWEKLRFQNAVWHGFVLVASGVFYSAVLIGVVLS